MTQEPGRIVFPVSPAPAAPPSRQAGEPRALVFPTTPASRRPVEQEPVGPSANPGPAPLSFANVPARPAPREAGQAAFDAGAHPLQASTLDKARQLAPAVAQHYQESLARAVRQLLPLRAAAIESFGERQLSECRRHAENAAYAAHYHARLRAAEMLSAAVDASVPRAGLKGALHRLTAEAPAQHRDRLQALRPQLAQLLDDVRGALPEAQADAARLAVHLLALRSVREVTGACDDTVLERSLTQRLETLRIALAQAELIPAQLKSQEGTLALQVAECDRLLHVTFSAVALARART